LEVKVVLISTYELGRQPFGLASPAAWLRSAGHEVTCADLAVGTLPSVQVREADLIAVYVPMHTATRLAGPVLKRVRALNPSAHLCCYGLYASLNETHLRSLGVESIVGGEFEGALLRLVESLANGAGARSETSTERLVFQIPDRERLPVLGRYPKLVLNGARKRVGYTEASRGCKHRCRHCPVVPVYQGSFRVVQSDVVLEDIRRQIAAGAEHITFGDPDFLNGPTHGRRIVEQMHAEYPSMTYDITAKVEHLLKHRDLLPVLRDTGCLFVISAVESVQEDVLEKLDKGHTTADFFEVAGLFKDVGLTLVPTFLPFTPWTNVSGFRALLDAVRQLDLIENVASVQWSLRLLIPSGSRLLELADTQRYIGPFDERALVYPWRHPDAQIDALGARVSAIVRSGVGSKKSRSEVFREVWEEAHDSPIPVDYRLLPRTVIPYMEEPWFC
jgi:radical SAM superfamily enzyme YgiQ (UPF0313 family)